MGSCRAWQEYFPYLERHGSPVKAWAREISSVARKMFITAGVWSEGWHGGGGGGRDLWVLFKKGGGGF